MDPASARRLLEAERDRVTNVLAIERRYRDEDAGDDTFSELSSVDQHQADSASETLQQEVDATIVAMEVERLADIEHALLRLAEGRYGSCETCGEPIADERLAAEPATRFCVDHERSWELRELDLSTPVLDAAPNREMGDLPGDLAGLPTDDDVDEELETSAEEVLHVERSPVTMAPQEGERAQVAEGGRRTDEQREASAAADVAAAAIGEVVASEQQLEAGR